MTNYDFDRIREKLVEWFSNILDSTIKDENMFEKASHINFKGFKRGATKNAMRMYDLSVKKRFDSIRSTTVQNSIDAILWHAQTIEAEYQVKECGGKILFVYSHEFYREDSVNKFRCVCDTAETHDMLFPKLLDPFGFSSEETRHVLRLAKTWYFQMGKTKLPAQERLYIISYLCRLFHGSQSMLRAINKRYNLVVFYYDAAPMESVVAATLKKSGFKTATLQHAMSYPVDLNADVCPTVSNAVLSLTEADYILLWNSISREQCVRFKKKKRGLFICGILSQIGVEPATLESKKTNTFGVILEALNEVNDQANRELIMMANQLCERYELKYVIRYHPTSKGDGYEKIIDKTYLRSVAMPDSSFKDFVSQVDFTLLTSSSSLCEIVYLNGLVFRYSPTWLPDRWAAVPYNKFSNAEELQVLFSQEKTSRITMIQNMQSLLSSDVDPQQGYKQFWKKFY